MVKMFEMRTGEHTFQPVATNNLREYLEGEPVVTRLDEDGTRTYDATWPNADPLDDADLHSLLMVLSPTPGLESPQQIRNNLAGIHEDGEFNKHIMRLHRERFGDAWRQMAASRRLLTTSP